MYITNMQMKLFVLLLSISFTLTSVNELYSDPDCGECSQKNELRQDNTNLGYMGGVFTNCDGRIIGPTEICDNSEALYGVLGDPADCETRTFTLDTNFNCQEEKGDAQLINEGTIRDGHWEKEWPNSEEVRVTVQTPENCFGSFDFGVETNGPDCDCDKAILGVKVIKEGAPECKDSDTRALCQFKQVLKALQKIADQRRNQNLREVVKKEYLPNIDQQDNVKNAIKTIAGNIDPGDKSIEGLSQFDRNVNIVVVDSAQDDALSWAVSAMKTSLYTNLIPGNFGNLVSFATDMQGIYAAANILDPCDNALKKEIVRKVLEKANES